MQKPRHAPIGCYQVSAASSTASWVHLNSEEEELRSIFHPAPKMHEVPIIQPIMVRHPSHASRRCSSLSPSPQNTIIEPVVINQITFLSDSVVTVSKTGDVRFWMRGKGKMHVADGVGAEDENNGNNVPKHCKKTTK